jgi:hypothetical protein
MALVDAALENDLRAILQLDSNGKSNVDEVIKKMALAVSNYMRSAQLQGVDGSGKPITGKLM